MHDVRRSELQVGDHAVVIGGGPIGVLIASVARHGGADVVIVELDAYRRDRIAALGFADAGPVAPSTRSPGSSTGPAESAPTWSSRCRAPPPPSLGATALAKVRGTIVVVAIHSQPRPIDLQRVFWRELRILGARVYQRSDFERAVELVAPGS